MGSLPPLGVALRSHVPAVVAWVAGTAGVGAVFGVFTDDITEVVAANPALADAMGSGAADDAAGHYVSYVLVLLVLMAIGCAAQGIGRVRAEETTGRLESVLATRVSRPRWLAVQASLVVLGACVVALVGGAALAAVADGSTGVDAGAVARAGAAYLPAVLVVGALGLLLVGQAPRATSLVWGAVGYVAFVELLGATLSLPEWAMALSPLHAVGRLPTEPADGTAVAVLVALAAVLAAVGVVGFRRRDVPR